MELTAIPLVRPTNGKIQNYQLNAEILYEFDAKRSRISRKRSERPLLQGSAGNPWDAIYLLKNAPGKCKTSGKRLEAPIFLHEVCISTQLIGSWAVSTFVVLCRFHVQFKKGHV